MIPGQFNTSIKAALRVGDWKIQTGSGAKYSGGKYNLQSVHVCECIGEYALQTG